MFSRIWLILLVVTAQLAGAGSLRAAAAADVLGCRPEVAPQHTMCCGEGCQCTPESCPCARPAEREEQIPFEAPTPAPSTSRIDLPHVWGVVSVHSIVHSPGWRACADQATLTTLDRAKLRATLGIWTT